MSWGKLARRAPLVALQEVKPAVIGGRQDALPVRHEYAEADFGSVAKRRNRWPGDFREAECAEQAGNNLDTIGTFAQESGQNRYAFTLVSGIELHLGFVLGAVGLGIGQTLTGVVRPNLGSRQRRAGARL